MMSGALRDYLLALSRSLYISRMKSTYIGASCVKPTRDNANTEPHTFYIRTAYVAPPLHFSTSSKAAFIGVGWEKRKDLIYPFLFSF